MKIVVVGDGKAGLAITAQLSSEGHDLTVVDSNSNVLEQSVEQFDVMVVHGNGASLPTLRRPPPIRPICSLPPLAPMKSIC